MPVTDEDVAQRQEEILALRAERDQAKIEAETAFKARDNEVTMVALDAEKAQLEREIELYQNQIERVDTAVEAQKAAVEAGATGAPAAEDTAALPADLDSYTKQQLLDFAQSAGISLQSSLSKDDMLAAIRAGKE